MSSEPKNVKVALALSSVGAMVAGGYGADRIMEVLTDRSRFKLPKPSRRGGLIGHETVIDAFCRELPERIESLQLPFAAVAVDISKGEVVILDRGPLKPALAASVAVPACWSPGDRSRYVLPGPPGYIGNRHRARNRSPGRLRRALN